MIGWLNRGTLHLVRTEDYWWLHALTTPPLFTGNARRLAQTGVTRGAADRGVAAIERALDRRRPADARRSCATACAPSACATEGQALVHLLMLACLRGIAVRGPMIGGKPRLRARARLARRAARRSTRERALAELARRYLARPRARGRPRSGEVGRAAAARRARRPGRDRGRARRARRRSARAEANRRAGVAPRRACSTSGIRCSSAGARASPSSSRYPRRDSPEAHFSRSRTSAPAPSRPGACGKVSSRSRAVRAGVSRRQRRARGRRRGRRPLPVSVRGAAGRTPTRRATPFRRASASANVGVMFDRDTCLAHREPNLSLRMSGSRRCLGRGARRAPLRARRPSRRDLVAGAGALLQLLPPTPPR